MEYRITVGMDMGDKSHRICVLDEAGSVMRTEEVANTQRALAKCFGALPPCVVAIEAGTHSPWVSRLLTGLGHEVLVGNPRKLRAIWDTVRKTDERDAEMLARIARFDRKLLCPVHHRGQEAQEHLAVIKARDQLVRVRAQLIAHVRATVKATGHRVASCSADAFHHRAAAGLPAGLHAAINGLLETIGGLTQSVHRYDKDIQALNDDRYPETAKLRAVKGVGPITSLAYVLTLEEAGRFDKSRSVGPFLGLTPRCDKSGQIDKQLRISKTGDEYLRRLLVGSAQYILGPFAPDCQLRRFGHKLARRGGKNAKRRAVVAVARKLAVLLHSLWSTGQPYDPFYKPAVPVRKVG
jgi:transposase